MKRAVFAITVSLALACSPAVADPRDDLAAAFGKAMDQGGFAARMEVAGRRPTTMEMRVRMPDRFHMKTEDTEMIMLPQGTWMYANGQWMQFPMNMSKMVEGFTQRNIDDGIAAITDVRVIGTDTIDGCKSTVYAYRTSGKFMGVDGRSNAEVAICEKSGLPVRMVTRDRRGDPEVTAYYDFTSDIDIRPPN